MNQLILRDIKRFGGYHIFILLLALGAGYFGPSYDQAIISYAIYFIPIFLSGFLFIIMLTDKEKRSTSESIFASMPVTRFDIVKSRYLSTLFYILTIVGIIYLSSNISVVLFDKLKGSTLSLIPTLFILSILLFFLSINLPIQFYDSKKAYMYNLLFIVALGFMPDILDSLGVSQFSQTTIDKIFNANYKLISPVFLIIALLMYLISLFVSKRIYEKKEF